MKTFLSLIIPFILVIISLVFAFEGKYIFALLTLCMAIMIVIQDEVYEEYNI